MSGYIKFELLPQLKNHRTQIWVVSGVSGGEKLGEIRWWSSWRQYAFHPEPYTVFEEDCLRAIAAFMELETRRRRADRAVERQTERSMQTSAASPPAAHQSEGGPTNTEVP